MRRVCPTCGRSTAGLPQEARRYLPFCGRRCQLIDLGKWFDERYRIPVDLSGEDHAAVPGQEGDHSCPKSRPR